MVEHTDRVGRHGVASFAQGHIYYLGSCEGSGRVIESAELIGRWPLVKVRCAIEEPTVAAL